MSEPIFVESHHEESGRFAVLEEDDKVAYLYLLRPDQSIEKSTLAYMRVDPIESADWHAAAKRGEPPTLSRDMATTDAVIADALAADLRIDWSSDGHAAVLLYRGTPITWVSAAEEHGYGYSKAISKAGGFGQPWDEASYQQVFRS